MSHWLNDLVLAFGPDAKITLDIDPMRSVTLRVSVERQGNVVETERRATWDEIRYSKVDPLACMAEDVRRIQRLQRGNDIDLRVRVDPIVWLLNEASDELAFMHRLCMERYEMDEPIGRVVRLIHKIQDQTGHVTDSPYPTLP